MIRYGKSSAGYLRLKSLFYNRDANRDWSDLAHSIGALYRQQPLRDGCVVCGMTFGEPSFIFHESPYSFCADCGHLNGHHEDTLEFTTRLYEMNMNRTTDVYTDQTHESFMQRVYDIYFPKVNFMCDRLRDFDEDPMALRYVDIGAGAGHFVVALQEAGLTNAVGYETSKELVESTNALFGKEFLRHNEVGVLNETVANIKADLIAMIFSLEHVHMLRSFLNALRLNPYCRYFYFAVPTVSPSIALEVLYPHVMPRVLGLGHTHLFSDRSIERMCRDFGLQRVAEWWFGATAFDFHRSISIQLEERVETRGLNSMWNDMMLPLIDDLNLVFDKYKFSSEVHLLTIIDR